MPPPTRHAALALLEFDSVAAGIRTADVMVKRAPIALLKAGTVHPGRYLVLLGGTVAPVEEAWRAGIEEGKRYLLDSVLLPDVHEEVYGGALGERRMLEEEALGVLETRTVATLLCAADAGVKGADVHIAELRLADDLGGRAFVLFDGRLNEVEAALEIGASRVEEETIYHTSLMPRLDGDLRRLLDAGTRFAPCDSIQPEGAELP
jgi:microcompartment protein CcmL/EutN